MDKRIKTDGQFIIMKQNWSRLEQSALLKSGTLCRHPKNWEDSASEKRILQHNARRPTTPPKSVFNKIVSDVRAQYARTSDSNRKSTSPRVR